MSNKEWLTPEEAMKYLEVDRGTLSRRAREHNIEKTRRTVDGQKKTVYKFSGLQQIKNSNGNKDVEEDEETSAFSESRNQEEKSVCSEEPEESRDSEKEFEKQPEETKDNCEKESGKAEEESEEQKFEKIHGWIIVGKAARPEDVLNAMNKTLKGINTESGVKLVDVSDSRTAKKKDKVAFVLTDYYVSKSEAKEYIEDVFEYLKGA